MLCNICDFFRLPFSTTGRNSIEGTAHAVVSTDRLTLHVHGLHCSMCLRIAHASESYSCNQARDATWSGRICCRRCWKNDKAGRCTQRPSMQSCGSAKQRGQHCVLVILLSMQPEQTVVSFTSTGVTVKPGAMDGVCSSSVMHMSHLHGISWP